jgi:type I restriction-modification system DNA methylase subunit
MAIKKSDLYSSIWASCDELRGGMDASQYKDYVLFMLFIKYITDKYGTPRQFVERESHYLWGRRYLLSVKEKEAPFSLIFPSDEHVNA